MPLLRQLALDAESRLLKTNRLCMLTAARVSHFLQFVFLLWRRLFEESQHIFNLNTKLQAWL